MGGNISANFDNIQPLFNVGIWKVHRATQKGTQREVSLWLIDYMLMKKYERNKKERRSYLEHIYKSLVLQKKLVHNNILSIVAISDPSKEMGFAAEPVFLSLDQNIQYSRDEKQYIAHQCAHVLNFLHTKANIAHLGFCPQSLVLNKQFTLKVSLFLHAVPSMDSTATLRHPFNTWHKSLFHVIPAWCAPEYVRGGRLNKPADIFMFALTLYYIFLEKAPLNATSAEDYFPQQALVNINKLQNDYVEIVTQMLSITIEERPTIASIMTSDAFNSLESKVFGFLLVIEESDLKNRYSFYQGLSKNLSLFSPRLQRFCFLPLFIKQVLQEARFGIALLPDIFKIADSLDQQEFLNEVFIPLQPVMSVSDPPQVTEFWLAKASDLLQKAGINAGRSVSVIISTALSSPYPAVQTKGVATLLNVVDSLSEDLIETEIATRLLTILENTEEESVALSIMKSLENLSKKLSNGFIAQKFLPVFDSVWKKKNWVSTSDSFSKIILCYTETPATKMRDVVPIVSLVLSKGSVVRAVQARLYDYIANVVSEFKESRGMVSRRRALLEHQSITATVSKHENSRAEPKQPFLASNEDPFASTKQNPIFNPHIDSPAVHETHPAVDEPKVEAISNNNNFFGDFEFED